MIFLIFMQDMKNRIKIIQERLKYDLMTNSVKKRLQYCQKVIAVCVINTYCSPPT